MKMFITVKERIGSCYFEFQFCKTNKPIKKGKVNQRSVKYWAEDTLLMGAHDFDKFYECYGNIFCCALFPNGDKGFDYFGINYYDKETTHKILLELKTLIDEKYIELIPWLENAVSQYNGFYILGI